MASLKEKVYLQALPSPEPHILHYSTLICQGASLETISYITACFVLDAHANKSTATCLPPWDNSLSSHLCQRYDLERRPRVKRLMEYKPLLTLHQENAVFRLIITLIPITASHYRLHRRENLLSV